MKCPICPDSQLLISERQGVEIDYCPQCRGVWLDRGELDKLIALSPVAQAPRQGMSPPRQDFQDSDQHRGSGYHPQRKKSWLGDIFD